MTCVGGGEEGEGKRLPRRATWRLHGRARCLEPPFATHTAPKPVCTIQSGICQHHARQGSFGYSNLDFSDGVKKGEDEKTNTRSNTHTQANTQTSNPLTTTPTFLKLHPSPPRRHGVAAAPIPPIVFIAPHQPQQINLGGRRCSGGRCRRRCCDSPAANAAAPSGRGLLVELLLVRNVRGLGELEGQP